MPGPTTLPRIFLMLCQGSTSSYLSEQGVDLSRGETHAEALFRLYDALDPIAVYEIAPDGPPRNVSEDFALRWYENLISVEFDPEIGSLPDFISRYLSVNVFPAL